MLGKARPEVVNDDGIMCSSLSCSFIFPFSGEMSEHTTQY